MRKLQASIRVVKAQYEMKHGRITIDALAEKAGISRHTVRRWMNGQFSEFKLETLEKLCRVLECEPGDILQMVEEEE